MVDVTQAKLHLRDTPISELVKFSTTLTDFAKKIMEIKHPVEEDLGFLYGAILTDGKDDFDENKGTHNICVFADRQVSILFFTFNFQLDSVHTSFKINSVNFYLRLTCCEVQIVPKRRRNNFQAFRLDFFSLKGRSFANWFWCDVTNSSSIRQKTNRIESKTDFRKRENGFQVHGGSKYILLL